MTTYDTLKQAVLDAEWYLADYPVAVRKDPRGDKKRSIFAAADLIRATNKASPLRTQREANGKWSVYQGEGYRTGPFDHEDEARRWIDRNAADYATAMPSTGDARADQALDFIDRYNGELNRQEIPPNGDDFNAIVDGIETILRLGTVPELKVKREGR